MKIDKILFSCSEPPEYSQFWNVQSRAWSKMGIEPVCLLYGKKANTDMSTDHGQIIEVEPYPDLPWSLQMTWQKFDMPRHEPDTTWIIGDIDLVPLQTHHFTTLIADIPDTAYVHLNAGGISQPRIGIHDGFLRDGSQRHAKDRGVCGGGADLPGHYHVAKGHMFNMYVRHMFSTFAQGRSFQDQIRYLMSGRYGMGPMDNRPTSDAQSNPYWHFWCAEENFTSEVIFEAIRHGLDFRPIYYNNNNATDRIHRDVWTGTDYVYDVGRAVARGYVDVHCARPFAKQADALNRLMGLTRMV